MLEPRPVSKRLLKDKEGNPYNRRGTEMTLTELRERVEAEIANLDKARRGPVAEGAMQAFRQVVRWLRHVADPRHHVRLDGHVVGRGMSRV
jgi:hypothetical protein